MNKRKEFTGNDNVTRQITEINRSAEYLKQITSIPSVSKGLDRYLGEMASIPSVFKEFDRHLGGMASIPSVFKEFDRHLERMASIPSVSKGLDRHLGGMASIPSVFKEFDRHLERMASIPSVSKGLDRHLGGMASIPSVFKEFDRHLERMASIPSVSKGLDRHLEQIAFATATLDGLSKLETLSSPIRAMTEANKSILAMNREGMLVNSMARSLPESLQQTQETIKSLGATFDTPAMLSASLAAQSKLFELQPYLLGAAIDAAAPLQESLRLNLDKFTTSYNKLFDFTDHQPSIIEALKPDIIQYPAHEVFREAELLEQITVPEDGQVVSDEYEVIPIPEERSLEDWLGEINSGFPSLLQGAHAVLNTDNPDRARHVASSLRELIGHVLRQLAPEDKIRVWKTDPSYYHNDRPTRRTRLLYICREVDFDDLSEFVNADVKLALTLIDALHAEAHVISRRLTDRQLQALLYRTESCLLFLLRLNSTNE